MLSARRVVIDTMGSAGVREGSLERVDRHSISKSFGAAIKTSSKNRCQYLFFFQAEDGIRDYKVTGVQTCALPISRALARSLGGDAARLRRPRGANRSVDGHAASRPAARHRGAGARRHLVGRVPARGQIGRASCRERVKISVVAVSLKKKKQ